MYHEIEVTTRKLELEKRRLAKLDEDVGRAKMEYDDKVMPKKKKKKEKEDEEEAAPEKAKEPMKLKALEYRLDKAISKYNNVSHENRVLRDKIDHIRRERIQLNQVFKKQIEDIRTTTKSIYSVKTESDEAKNVTEEYKVRISALRKKRDRERKLFSMDVERIKEETKKQDREKKTGRGRHVPRGGLGALPAGLHDCGRGGGVLRGHDDAAHPEARLPQHHPAATH
jgi:hypothetical protein